VPRKVRDLKADLGKSGAVWRPGKGSHSVWTHPRLLDAQLTLSGNDGDDAQRYQEKDVREFLAKIDAARRE